MGPAGVTVSRDWIGAHQCLLQESSDGDAAFRTGANDRESPEGQTTSPPGGRGGTSSFRADNRVWDGLKQKRMNSCCLKVMQGGFAVVKIGGGALVVGLGLGGTPRSVSLCLVTQSESKHLKISGS